MKYCENHVFVWKLSHHYGFFFAVYLGREPRTMEHGRLFSNYKQYTLVWNWQLHYYRQEHKCYLQGLFELVMF